jgi:glucose-1-phosphate adenylyltransferase
MVCNGCIIEGRVENSILSPGVKVAKNAVIKHSIILSDSVIGRDSVIDYSILDKEVVVGAGSRIGFGDDFQVNHKEPDMLNTGITVVGKGAKLPEGVKIGRNCEIACNVTEDNFPSLEIQSGETITTRRRRSSRK